MGMQIYFERTGGYANIPVSTAVNTADLTVEEAENLEHMVDDTHFFELPEHLKNGIGADHMAYKLTVVTEEQQHTVQMTDASAPDDMRPLLRSLTRMARRKRVTAVTKTESVENTPCVEAIN